MHEFAQGGLHGTPVDRIARRVGVAQPYVFACSAPSASCSWPPSSAALSRSARRSRAAAEEFDPAMALPDIDLLKAMGNAYVELLSRTATT